jgi:hypothetical protein
MFPLVPAISLALFFAPQSLANVIADVSAHVKEFQELLPDFVCSEKITSTRTDPGKSTRQKTVESVFTVVQKLSRGNRHMTITETRDVTAIDGKPVRQGTKMPDLPFSSGSGFSAVLVMTFSPQSTDVHNYEMRGADKLGEGDRLLVQFETKADQTKLRTFLNGRSFPLKDVGKAWIDSASMQVVRLERHLLNIPSALSSYSNTIDYGPVTIGERQFWMPKMVRADVTEKDVKKTGTYIAEYSNCRKFTANVEIKIAP